MARVIRRARTPSQAAEEYAQATKAEEAPKADPKELIVSTGSTLLDLAIFGGRIRGGGLPGGLIVEIFGEAQLGKTAILAEICGCSQNNGGEVKFADPEGRLDREYAEIYGVNLPEDKYWRPDVVEDVFEDIREWNPTNKNVVNIYGCDSLAALSSRLEMDKGDKMGMKIAKEMSAGLRKTGRLIAEDGYKCLVCTNQLRHGESGSYTPGGKGVPFWASVRISIKAMYKKKFGRDHLITKEVTLESNRKVPKVIGINSLATVIKNSKDDPHRDAYIPIIFNHGIDDIRANLQWQKDMKKAGSYECGDGTTYQAMDYAIQYVERENLELKLREQVIDLWEEIEEKFKKATRGRKRKVRW
jgi:RecA/RadA recombinase